MGSQGPDKPVTVLLEAAAAGDSDAAETLLPLVYEELRRLAEARLRKTPPGNTLQATALVHEAYLRLVGKTPDEGWEGRRHFFFAAARAMHDILVERARRRASRRRAEEGRRLDPDLLVVALDSPDDELLALHEALRRLERVDPRKHQIVMLRFFAGLTIEQVADVLGVSEPTIKRDWRFIRTSLYAELAQRTDETTDAERAYPNDRPESPRRV